MNEEELIGRFMKKTYWQEATIKINTSSKGFKTKTTMSKQKVKPKTPLFGDKCLFEDTLEFFDNLLNNPITYFLYLLGVIGYIYYSVFYPWYS